MPLRYCHERNKNNELKECNEPMRTQSKTGNTMNQSELRTQRESMQPTLPFFLSVYDVTFHYISAIHIFIMLLFV